MVIFYQSKAGRVAGVSACGVAPSHWLESSFCCWTAGKGLAQKECSFTETGIVAQRGCCRSGTARAGAKAARKDADHKLTKFIKDLDNNSK